jgi:hypothetical protein
VPKTKIIIIENERKWPGKRWKQEGNVRGKLCSNIMREIKEKQQINWNNKET